MLGFIFFEFKQYVIENYGLDMWEKLAAKTQPATNTYQVDRPYPDEDLLKMMHELATEAHQTLAFIEEDFGVFTAPFLLRISAYLISPEWGLMDLLAHTQEVIHTRLAKSIKTSTTPFLNITREGLKQVTIIYQSPRKMCFFAKGLLRGLSSHYQTPIVIQELTCMHKGDDRCELRVTVQGS